MSSYYNYIVSWWEEIEAPSEDEAYIIEYLKNYNLSNFDILHVGIGNNFIVKAFPSSRVTGLTISILEYQKAISVKHPSYLPILIDKHDPALDGMLGKYDIIIDNNIGSYSPDFESACSFLKIALKHLRPGGSLITHQEGLAYGNPLDLQEALQHVVDPDGRITVTSEPNGVIIIK